VLAGGRGKVISGIPRSRTPLRALGRKDGFDFGSFSGTVQCGDGRQGGVLREEGLCQLQGKGRCRKKKGGSRKNRKQAGAQGPL
jgi:hypothetical protein